MDTELTLQCTQVHEVGVAIAIDVARFAAGQLLRTRTPQAELHELDVEVVRVAVAVVVKGQLGTRRVAPYGECNHSCKATHKSNRQ